MKCPECGFEQKPREVCSVCGLVLSDYLAKKALERDRPEPTAEQVKRGQMVSIRRGHKVIRNVNTRDLPEKIQRGEIYSSDEISQDEKKWIHAGKHPQLKALFEKPPEVEESKTSAKEKPKDPDIEVHDPEKKARLKRLAKKHASGKLSDEDYTQQRNKILKKAMDEQRKQADTGEKRATLAGGLGVLMISIAIYLPIYKVRLVPDIILYSKSIMATGAIIFLTLFAMFDMARNNFRWSRSIGLVIASSLFAIHYMQSQEIAQVLSGKQETIVGGIFNGFDKVGVEKIKPAWGWAVFAGGAFLVHLSGWLRGRVD
ncbi:MAG: hypothetical protein G3M70_03910 [Candidatus Nitronauta litoralis]|uniref:Uncharacterized protein n=1 Tax=Candidatus Nitronauta litoralis TaxID=2705533 RepID=A0A7T0FZE0_9BACT|nr:MAG: hypothetical protein G3M70_03910 [Candidatus Nitronauta litoralis]